MLRAIGLQRYRAYLDLAQLEIRPLTVLFGRNSAGKSALLRALPLVAASFGATKANRTGPLALEHEAALGATYGDFRSRLSSRNDLVIDLDWDDAAADLARGIEYHLRDITDLTRVGQVVERAVIGGPSGNPELEMVLDVESGRHLIGQETGWVEFDGLMPRLCGPLSPSVQVILDEARGALSRFEGTVDWLGPLRTSVPRRVQPVENATILHDGQGTTELLSDPRQSGLLIWVQTQLRELFGHDVEPQPDGHEVRLVARFADGKLAPLADVGSGVSQVLPALAHLARVATGAADGRIVAIEQPEAHLHADAEAALGRAITEALAGTRERPAARHPRMIIETHSENILLALQLAVLQRRLPCDDFVAYWVSRRPDGSAWIERITFDEQARPDPDWPSGVFSETTGLARQVLNARRRSQR